MRPTRWLGLFMIVFVMVWVFGLLIKPRLMQRYRWVLYALAIVVLAAMTARLISVNAYS